MSKKYHFNLENQSINEKSVLYSRIGIMDKYIFFTFLANFI